MSEQTKTSSDNADPKEFIRLHRRIDELAEDVRCIQQDLHQLRAERFWEEVSTKIQAVTFATLLFAVWLYFYFILPWMLSLTRDVESFKLMRANLQKVV